MPSSKYNQDVNHCITILLVCKSSGLHFPCGTKTKAQQAAVPWSASLISPQDGHWKNSPDCGALKVRHQTAVTGTLCTEHQGTAQDGANHRQAGLVSSLTTDRQGNTGHAQKLLKDCQEEDSRATRKALRGHRGKVKSGSCQGISCCSWLRMETFSEVN